MLDDLNDDVSEVGTETGEENNLELTPEEVDAAYGLEENGVEGGAPPGDTREESEKAESTSLETDKGVDNSGGMEHIDTRNQELAGQEHPETGVRYEHCSVTLEDGKNYDVVAPRFESQFDVALNKEDYGKSDYLQS